MFPILPLPRSKRLLACAAAFASALVLASCGGGGGGGGGGGDGGNPLTVTTTTPGDSSTGNGLSLSQVTVTFDSAIATTYDAGSFSYPHLEDVAPYLLLVDTTPIPDVTMGYFLDRDFSDDHTVVLYISSAPQAGHVYRLTAIAGLPNEAGAVLAADRQVEFTMGGSVFGGDIYANRVISYAPEVPSGATTGEGRYIAASILGQPEGSLHTVSLGDDDSDVGGSITVGFGDDVGGTSYCIVDDTGDDFVVYENVFVFDDGTAGQRYTEAAFVEVSNDGTTWYRFNHTEPGANTGSATGVPGNYSGFAGINTRADGGDGFDIGTPTNTTPNLPGAPGTFQVCYVRLIDAGTTVFDYDHSEGIFATWDGSGADIDAIQAIHYVAAPDLVDP